MSPTEHSTDSKVSELFDAVWIVLLRILGGAMTATIVRRAIQECSVPCRKLSQIVIEKKGVVHKCTVPLCLISA